MQLPPKYVNLMQLNGSIVNDSSDHPMDARNTKAIPPPMVITDFVVVFIGNIVIHSQQKLETDVTNLMEKRSK